MNENFDLLTQITRKLPEENLITDKFITFSYFKLIEVLLSDNNITVHYNYPVIENDLEYHLRGDESRVTTNVDSFNSIDMDQN